MKRKYAIKKHAKNLFSSLSGIEAIDAGDCLVTKNKTAGHGIPIKRYAYVLYSGNRGLNPNVKVINKCGLDNCVKKDHLLAIFKPNLKEREYIKDYLKMDGSEQIAFRLKVPLDLLTDYLSKIKQ